MFSAKSAVPLIIDTDASFDVDDVVAICMAHALMDNGEVMSIIFFMMLMMSLPYVWHMLLWTMGR